jgi:hypothetical protein
MPVFNKSVLGQAFDDFVQDQLKVRSQKLSSTEGDVSKGNINRESDILNYTLGKTAFIRLTSGVDITEEMALSLFNNPNFAGSGLAKNHILQAGTLNSKGGLRGGFSGANSAYTLGGISDFGLRPMPGIISAQINSKGRWGSLREAQIEIKCFNRDQLSIIELLYMRPGYTILLEWGHTVFYDNKGNLVTNVQFLDLFQDGMTRNQFYKDMLRKQRQYAGNFDCFIGPVSNFNITQNGDGSYDCRVNAFSWGYVIESLKINASSTVPTKSTSNNLKIENDNQPGVEKVPEKNSKSRLSSILDSYFNTCNKFNDKKNHKIFIKNIYQKDMDKDPTGHSVNPTGSFVDSGSLSTFAAIPFVKARNNDPTAGELENNNTDVDSYMPLGTLLSVISKNCLLYNTAKPNSGSQNIPESNYKDPIVNINFNTSENYCFSPEHQISINPHICLIKYSGPDLELFGLSSKANKINPYLPEFKNTKYTGNIMNIMVNINHILTLLNQLEVNNENREVYLYDFLSELMRSINIALGAVNEFNVGIDDETNTLTIYDKQLLEVSPKEISIINTTGLKSVVRKVSINTRLSGQLASMIAIGAQASGVGIGIDASVFSQYNTGLTDRLMKDKKDSVANNDFSLPDYLNCLKNDERVLLLKRTIENIYSKQMLITDDIENCKNIYSDILNTIKGKDVNTKASTVIPFSFDIQMDGLSGIKYGQMFSIEPSRLPKSYLNPKDKTQPNIGFLVYSIEHIIHGNSWLTDIKGQAAPLRDARIKP